MRVIAGTAGGRRLTAPRGRDTRPTSDRVKEALFSALAPRLAGARVLDLYAGSGALGIEALSRGAERAVMVERDPRAAAVISRNLARCGLDGGIVRVEDVARYCRDARDGPFEVVVADPPYDVGLAAVLEQVSALSSAGAMVPGALVVLERAGDRDRLAAALPETTGDVAWTRLRAYGDTVLVWGRVREEPR